MSKIYPDKFILDQIVLDSKINNQLILTKFEDHFIINYKQMSLKIDKNSIFKVKIINREEKNRIFININNNNLEYNFEGKVLDVKKIEMFFDNY